MAVKYKKQSNVYVQNKNNQRIYNKNLTYIHNLKNNVYYMSKRLFTRIKSCIIKNVLYKRAIK